MLLTALMLDGGGSFRISSVAFAAYWPMAGLIVCRRPNSPTRVDLFAMRWGYPIIVIAVGVFGSILWTLLGRR
jgi:hypothetical protein